MNRRNLLLCFDAFGTLIHPKRPVAEQYAAVARQCGLEGVTAEQVHAAFKVAYSTELKAHPNYGKSTGLGAERWWTNVIRKTFAGWSDELPKDLAPRLLHRFTSAEGYDMTPGVASLLRSLKQQQYQNQQQRHGHRHQPQILVGVITNSDDRVPSVLSSLGLGVSPARFGTPFNAAELAGRQYDIDLHCMSYDVGYAKPDRRIFDAAVGMADKLVAAAAPDKPGTGGPGERKQGEPWLKVYVGDEYVSDVVGAREAGWHPVYVGTGERLPAERFSDLKQLRAKTLDEAFPEGGSTATMRTESTQEFLEWLVERYKLGQG